MVIGLGNIQSSRFTKLMFHSLIVLLRVIGHVGCKVADLLAKAGVEQLILLDEEDTKASSTVCTREYIGQLFGFYFTSSWYACCTCAIWLERMLSTSWGYRKSLEFDINRSESCAGNADKTSPGSPR